MNRWAIALVVVALSCIPLLQVHRYPTLLGDGDTSALLRAIRQRRQPLSWFVGDWPLNNHFYRPVPTLTFEVDNRLYGDQAAGYQRTNVLLAFLSVLLLFWFARELTDRPVLSAASASLFGLWIGGAWFDRITAGCWALAGVCVLVGLLPKRSFASAALASLTAVYAGFEIGGYNMTSLGIEEMPGTMLAWLPSRTASVMTVFALISMAAYARYERVGRERTRERASPFDLPATKSTRQASGSKDTRLWLVLSGAACALALASYEQAIMLPAALVIVAVSFRVRGYQVRWLPHVVFWVLLAAYFVARRVFLPSGISSYQQQQFWDGPSVWISTLAWIFPATRVWGALGPLLENGLLIAMLINQFWSVVLLSVSNIAGYVAARRRWVIALAAWTLSVVTFLPMAWVKPFAHYVFWPLAMRSIFAMTMLWVTLEWLVTAASPRAIQAPQRLDPAPGSLPRR